MPSAPRSSSGDGPVESRPAVLRAVQVPLDKAGVAGAGAGVGVGTGAAGVGALGGDAGYAGVALYVALVRAERWRLRGRAREAPERPEARRAPSCGRPLSLARGRSACRLSLPVARVAASTEASRLAASRTSRGSRTSSRALRRAWGGGPRRSNVSPAFPRA